MAIVFALLGALCVAWCGGWCVAHPSDLHPSAAGRALMLLLYGLTFFFSNFGPNRCPTANPHPKPNPNPQPYPQSHPQPQPQTQTPTP